MLWASLLGSKTIGIGETCRNLIPSHKYLNILWGLTSPDKCQWSNQPTKHNNPKFMTAIYNVNLYLDKNISFIVPEEREGYFLLI